SNSWGRSPARSLPISGFLHGRATFATRSQVSGAPSACSVINRSSPWPRACGGPGPGSRVGPSPQCYNRPPCPPEEGAGLRGQADPRDDRRGARRECGPVDWRMALRVGSVLRRWRPSIVQTHGYKATAVAYLLRRLQHRPWHWIGFHHGVTTEDVKDRFYHWVDKQLLRAADRVVVMSQ